MSAWRVPELGANLYGLIGRSGIRSYLSTKMRLMWSMRTSLCWRCDFFVRGIRWRESLTLNARHIALWSLTLGVRTVRTDRDRPVRQDQNEGDLRSSRYGIGRCH